MWANVTLTSYAVRRCLAGWEVISAVKQKQQISHYCCTEFHRQVTSENTNMLYHTDIKSFQVHQDSRAEVGLQGHCPFLPTTDVHLPWSFLCRQNSPDSRSLYRVWSAHAADSSSVFGQSIFGKPCFWQNIVWQTECTENWKVMLLDIIRKFRSLPSYVNKSPINNMRRFLRREIQLMMTRGMRVTTNNCKAMDAPWIWAKGARDNHSLGKHSGIWMHTSAFSEDIICLMTLILSQSSLLTDLGYDTWVSLLSALLTLVRLLYITLFHFCQL